MEIESGDELYMIY